MSTKKEIIHQVIDLLNKDFKKKLKPPVSYDSRYDDHDYGIEFYYPKDIILDESLNLTINGLYEYIYNRKHDYETREDAKRHAENFFKAKNIYCIVDSEMAINIIDFSSAFYKFDVHVSIPLRTALYYYNLYDTFINAN